MDSIVKKLAAKYGLDEEVIERVIRSQFYFVANTIQEGEYQSVHLHHFGKFAVRPNAITRINKLKELKESYAKDRE